jgi:O-antigen/teichoic acid export membrane protein
VVLARYFEPTRYGLYVGTLSAILFLSPFASLGAGDLLCKRYASQLTRMPQCLSLARGLASVGGLVTLALLVIARTTVLPSIPLTMLLALGAAELLCNAWTDVAIYASQAAERLVLSSIIRAVQGGTRLLALVAMLAIDSSPTLTTWSLWYLGAAFASTVVGNWIIDSAFGGFRRLILPSRANAREGTALMLGWGTDRIRSDADKFLLLRLDSSGATGIYGAAYRVIDIAFVPVRALTAATGARFWRDGRDPKEARRLAIKLTLPAAAYGAAIGVGVLIFAPLIEDILGSDWHDTTNVLRWLALVPLITALQIFPATALTTSDKARTRIVLVIAAVLGNIALNVALIPRFGWRGAAGATIATEAALAAGFWIALARLTSAPRTAEAPRTAPVVTSSPPPLMTVMARSGSEDREQFNMPVSWSSPSSAGEHSVFAEG